MTKSIRDYRWWLFASLALGLGFLPYFVEETTAQTENNPSRPATAGVAAAERPITAESHAETINRAKMFGFIQNLAILNFPGNENFAMLLTGEIKVKDDKENTENAYRYQLIPVSPSGQSDLIAQLAIFPLNKGSRGDRQAAIDAAIQNLRRQLSVIYDEKTSELKKKIFTNSAKCDHLSENLREAPLNSSRQLQETLSAVKQQAIFLKADIAGLQMKKGFLFEEIARNKNSDGAADVLKKLNDMLMQTEIDLAYGNLRLRTLEESIESLEKDIRASDDFEMDRNKLSVYKETLSKLEATEFMMMEPNILLMQEAHQGN
jgi:hypothetical protein